MVYMTKLQKAMAKYAGRKLTDKDLNQMKVDACLLIGCGITDKYYEKTFGPNGSVRTLEDAERFASDADTSTGSFNPFAVMQVSRHRKSKKDDEENS